MFPRIRSSALECFRLEVDGLAMLLQVGTQRKRLSTSFPVAFIPPNIEVDGVDMELEAVHIAFDRFPAARPAALV